METPEETVRRFTIYPEQKSVSEIIEDKVTNGLGYYNPVPGENNTFLDLLIHLGRIETREEIRTAILYPLNHAPSETMKKIQEYIRFQNKHGIKAKYYSNRSSLRTSSISRLLSPNS